MAKIEKHKSNVEGSADRILQKIIDHACTEPCMIILKWTSEQYPTIIIINGGKVKDDGKGDSILGVNRLLHGDY